MRPTIATRITTGLLLGGAGFLLALAACGDDPVSPSVPRTFDGVRFSIESQPVFSAAGLPDVDAAGVLKLASLAAAHPDSLGGLAITALQTTGPNSGDLFVLQLHPASTGTFACSDQGSPACHGRLILGMQLDTTWKATTRYTIRTGTVTVSRVGPDGVAGTFSARLTAPGLPDIVVTDGRLDVPLVAGATANAVSCLDSAGQSSHC